MIHAKPCPWIKDWPYTKPSQVVLAGVGIITVMFGVLAISVVTCVVVSLWSAFSWIVMTLVGQLIPSLKPQSSTRRATAKGASSLAVTQAKERERMQQLAERAPEEQEGQEEQEEGDETKED